jgi:transposase
MGGHRPFLLEGEKDWLLARFAAKPDATLAAVLGELKERGVDVGLTTLWRFLKRQGVSFKKNRVRHRAGPPGRGPQARAMEEISGKT